MARRKPTWESLKQEINTAMEKGADREAGRRLREFLNKAQEAFRELLSPQTADTDLERQPVDPSIARQVRKGIRAMLPPGTMDEHVDQPEE